MQEDLSKAYLSALASATGMTVFLGSQDYDCIDVTLKSRVDYSPPGMVGPRIDVQLKCTTQVAIAAHPTDVAWPLGERCYRTLAGTNRSAPALLCVLVAPKDAGLWLHSNTAGLLSRSHMYWLWGHQFPTFVDGQASQQLMIPKANLLTPQVLLDLMEEASKWSAVL